MFSSGGALFLASVLTMAGLSAAAICFSNGLNLPCERTVVCETRTASLRCGGGKVIRVHRADYGRGDFYTCINGKPASQTRNAYCAAASGTRRVATMCNGRSSCAVPASNSVFGDPCRNTYKYLLVEYFCEPRNVLCEYRSKRICCNGGKVIRILGADYGRRDRTTCASGRPASQIWNVNCASPTSPHYVARLCNGKHSCVVSANFRLYGDPCYGTYKYLQLAFRCV